MSSTRYGAAPTLTPTALRAPTPAATKTQAVKA